MVLVWKRFLCEFILKPSISQNRELDIETRIINQVVKGSSYPYHIWDVMIKGVLILNLEKNSHGMGV